MGRSEMWRLKQHLTNSCVYVNKKIEYCESIRCQGKIIKYCKICCVKKYSCYSGNTLLFE